MAYIQRQKRGEFVHLNNQYLYNGDGIFWKNEDDVEKKKKKNNGGVLLFCFAIHYLFLTKSMSEQKSKLTQISIFFQSRRLLFQKDSYILNLYGVTNNSIFFK